MNTVPVHQPGPVNLDQPASAAAAPNLQRAGSSEKEQEGVKRVCWKTLIPVFQAHEGDALKSGYLESFVTVWGSPRPARPQNIPVA